MVKCFCVCNQTQFRAKFQRSKDNSNRQFNLSTLIIDILDNRHESENGFHKSSPVPYLGCFGKEKENECMLFQSSSRDRRKADVMLPLWFSLGQLLFLAMGPLHRIFGGTSSSLPSLLFVLGASVLSMSVNLPLCFCFIA